MSTLSVLTSSSGSSASTCSPTSFSQRETVPSVTDSPRAGSTTSVASPADAGLLVGAGSLGVGASSACSTAPGAAVCSTPSVAGAVDCSDASPMTASTAPTGATSSSLYLISSRTPDAGEGISVSTLSVLTSSKGSSASTCSPTSLSQRETVPSVTLSPRAGRVTSVDMGKALLRNAGGTSL
ncbi:hypothetical protein SDC9_90543 [bioreactor metagenome]|uniref:Uncharacterized protein n=1 Tax=bioreactor metagenome TaxID=1076179 RepID=A0A644ZSZ1_9ZZZZ